MIQIHVCDCSHNAIQNLLNGSNVVRQYQPVLTIFLIQLTI
jgi:hypothetical protein